MTCEAVERDVDAYIDRELDPEADRLVRSHLTECPRCRSRVTERQALSRLVRAVQYHSAPDRLRAHVSRQTTRTITRHRLLTWAAAAAVIIAAGGAVALGRWATPRSDGTVQQVVDGHVRSLMGDHLFDVRSTDQHTVKPWFNGRLDVAPPVIDLTALGFTLLGGRLDYVGAKPVAAIVYRRRVHVINLFCTPTPDSISRGAKMQSLHGFNVRSWAQNGLNLWAVSDIGADELTEFGEKFEAALRQ